MVYYKYCLDKRFLDMLTALTCLKEILFWNIRSGEYYSPAYDSHILVHHLKNVAKSSYLEKLQNVDILYNYKEPIDWLGNLILAVWS